jgi:TM2 domain-containing membrane protein YozV
MSTSPEPAKPEAHPRRRYDPFAAVLSYLIPGLGQIYQGRLVKGLLFMVSLLGMFIFGMAMGSWKNVYIFDTGKESPGPVHKLIDRIRYVGQFPIGVVAWPALLQYNDKWPIAEQFSPFWHKFQRVPSEDELNRLQAAGDKTWDLAWVYTIIAGVLNILVIYDALAGPAFLGSSESKAKTQTPVQEAVPA